MPVTINLDKSGTVKEITAAKTLIIVMQHLELRYEMADDWLDKIDKAKKSGVQGMELWHQFKGNSSTAMHREVKKLCGEVAKIVSGMGS